METVRATFENLLQSPSPPTPLVKRVRNLTRIIYSSAIAHPLARQAQLPVAIVVRELVPILQQRLQQLSISLGLPISLEAQATLKVHALDTGFIELEFSDHTIALWLQDLLASKLLPPPQSCPKLQPQAVFAAQYSHARCCGLLRLAHSEKLIALQELDSEPIKWQLNPSLVELNSDLQCGQAGRCLLNGLFSLWESLFQPIHQPDKILWMANQSFQQFHRDVQLFDRDSDPIRWLLLLALQRVIYRSLETLQVPIPAAL